VLRIIAKSFEVGITPGFYALLDIIVPYTIRDREVTGTKYV